MSQVSHGEPLFREPLFYGCVELIEAAAQRRVGFSWFRHDFRQAGPQQAVVASRAKQNRAPTSVGHTVTMGFRHTLD